MRTATLAAAVLLLSSVSAFAQTAPAHAPATEPSQAPAPVEPVYNTTDYDLGTLLDNPETKAVLDKHIATLISNEQINMARGMTLRGLQQYAGDMLSDETLSKIDADLAKIAVKP